MARIGHDVGQEVARETMNLEGLSILLVEEDPATVEIVKLGLSYEGGTVHVADDGIEGVRLHAELAPDVVLLDIMLPRLDGVTALKRIRAARDTPIILLTAKAAVEDRVKGLEAGADDYVTKPFHFDELVARIRSALRRERPEDSTLEVADLTIDLERREVRRSGKRIELSPKQFEILRLLALRSTRVVSKEEIYESVWGWDYYGDPRVVEQHICRLRRRLDRGFPRKLIHTVHGMGYVVGDRGAS